MRAAPGAPDQIRPPGREAATSIIEKVLQFLVTGACRRKPMRRGRVVILGGLIALLLPCG